jgi:hypothetical protein
MAMAMAMAIAIAIAIAMAIPINYIILESVAIIHLLPVNL